MITQICNVKNFGIFRDFRWNSTLPDFEQYNVFYGWNYSGKTTISRVFRCYELKRRHADYGTATFQIQDHNQNKYDHLQLNNHPLNIRVFNSDFIHDNLRWEEGLEPIFILGKENIELENQLKEKRTLLEKINGDIDATNHQLTSKESDLETKKTNKARDIKTILSIPNFDKSKLQSYIDRVQDPTIYTLSDVDTILTTYCSNEKKPAMVELSLLEKMDEEVEAIQKILIKSVHSNIIQKLKDNIGLSDWVKKGKDLHKDKTTCEFCGGLLPGDLIDKLNGHYSDEYEKTVMEIDNRIVRLKKRQVGDTLPNFLLFYKDIQSEYQRLRQIYLLEIQKYNEKISKLIDVLEDKKSKLFQPIVLDVIQDNTNALNENIEKINEFINRHNNKTSQFDAEKNDAKEKLLFHYAAEFVKDNNYRDTCKAIYDLKAKIGELSGERQIIQREVLDLEKRLSEAVKGAEAINMLLKAYLGKDDIQISATVDNKFKLMRSGIEAKNLSEGEKTAISFAYFVSRCHDKNTEISKTIIFIDDPISSLDNNHLFHTYSMIKNTFGGCEQLFIATHNFEFFNLIKDWLKNETDKTSKRVKWKYPFYLVNRSMQDDNYVAKISILPDILYKFKSEYHYLFSLIYSFNKTPTTDHNVLYNLPNLVRRFLEAFMGFKVPTHAGLHTKLSSLICDNINKEKVIKFIDHYSHNASLPRSLKFPDLGECRDVVAIVIESIDKKDKEHYDCLIGEISNGE